MIYTLETPLPAVKGIGPAIATALATRGFLTVKDFLLFVPLRYEDRSLRKTIAQVQPDEIVTIEAAVNTTNNFYKGSRSIQSATISDETGRLKVMWFNNPYIISRLKKDELFLFSGKVNDRGTMMQPIVESAVSESIHTGRLVPMYSSLPDVAPTTLRKILKHILDELCDVTDPVAAESELNIETITTALKQLHFPDSEEGIVNARERFALEELLELIHRSHELKIKWREGAQALSIEKNEPLENETRSGLPFSLTNAQEKCIAEIQKDIAETLPMNRLLIGDVGSGKTAVVGMVAQQIIARGENVALVAPTQILAEQHCKTFGKLFPKIHVELLTAKTQPELQPHAQTLYIGTHAVLNVLEKILPALVVYDEQHRFGVMQRSLAQSLSPRPHVLTLSATPIPRTLMLSIFSHLHVSIIDEMPAGRKPIKTWVIPEVKRKSAYTWMLSEIAKKQQVLIVCPFIDTSESEGLEHVAAATDMFTKMKKVFAKEKLRISLLHGRLSKKEQSVTTTQLYNQEIDILVTTPIVEVGVDLPAASTIVIEAAERFGLASLHQMRGRVGRAGQEAYCLLFTNVKNADGKKRLETFSRTHSGMKLAEQDLQRRGAGDIFGTVQHGFEDLQFASWSNLELIMKAKKIAEYLEEKNIHWIPFMQDLHPVADDVPLAN